MQTRTIEARLRKLEATSSRLKTWFIVWGLTVEAAQEKAQELFAAGVVHPRERETVMLLAWRGKGPLPDSRRTDLDNLTRGELDTLLAHLRARAVEEERGRAFAAEENIAGLDHTDFYIRHLRRCGDHTTLRMLKWEENPEPGDIGMEAHRAHIARLRAWEARYMPESAEKGPTYADARH